MTAKRKPRKPTLELFASGGTPESDYFCDWFEFQALAVKHGLLRAGAPGLPYVKSDWLAEK